MYSNATWRSRRSRSASGVVRTTRHRRAYSGTCLMLRHAPGLTGSLRAESLYVPASEEPSCVDTGTNACNCSALRIVHGASVARAATSSAAGGPSERHARRGRPSHTAKASGRSRTMALARVRIARPASTPVSTA